MFYQYLNDVSAFVTVCVCKTLGPETWNRLIPEKKQGKQGVIGGPGIASHPQSRARMYYRGVCVLSYVLRSGFNLSFRRLTILCAFVCVLIHFAASSVNAYRSKSPRGITKSDSLSASRRNTEAPYTLLSS